MKNQSDVESEIENELVEKYGQILPSRVLWKILGYSSPAAWRQSVARKTVPIPIFKLEGRRGYFAITKDVAFFIGEQRRKAVENHKERSNE